MNSPKTPEPVVVKLCPFCGGDVDAEGWLCNDGRRGPECNDCGATAESVEQWNKRVPTTPSPAPWCAACGTYGHTSGDCPQITKDQTIENYGDPSAFELNTALKYFNETGNTSLSSLQRKFKIGYIKASKIMEQIKDQTKEEVEGEEDVKDLESRYNYLMDRHIETNKAHDNLQSKLALYSSALSEAEKALKSCKYECHDSISPYTFNNKLVKSALVKIQELRRKDI